MAKRLNGVNLESLIQATAKTLLAQFERSAASSRPDHKGKPREAEVRKFLRQVLPPKWGVAQAHVIYGGSQTSLEFDVVVYDMLETPRWPCEDGDDARLLIPIEAVLGIIEVKSSLTDRSLNEARAKIGEFDTIAGRRIGETEFRPFRHIFAYRESARAFQEWGSATRSCCHYASGVGAQPDGIFVLGDYFAVLASTSGISRTFALEHGTSAEEVLKTSWDIQNEMLRRDIHIDPSYLMDYIGSQAPGGNALVAMVAFIADEANKYIPTDVNRADMISAWLSKKSTAV